MTWTALLFFAGFVLQTARLAHARTAHTRHAGRLYREINAYRDLIAGSRTTLRADPSHSTKDTPRWTA